MTTLSPEERALAVPGPQPGFLPPMLATLADAAPADDGWVYERKLDGVRVLACRRGDRTELLSRTGKQVIGTYPEIAEAVGLQTCEDFVLDGEVVAFEGNTTSFARLQGRMQITDPVRARRSGVAVSFYAFDVLHAEGLDVRPLPLSARKRILQDLLAFTDPLRWSEPRGTRTGFGALLVGFYDGPDLVFAGKVGTGFDGGTLVSLHQLLRQRERPTPPFTRGTLPRRDVHWVEPDLVAEVAFTEWTSDNRLRHPRFLGLRSDKDPRTVVQERGITP